MNAHLKERLASLPPDKIRALVAKMGGKGGTPPHVPAEIHPGKPYPLSSAQERIWFLCQLAPDSVVYNNPLSVRLTNTVPLDPSRLEQGLRELARRHTILRTTFENNDGSPVQIVHEDARIRVESHDLRESPAALRERAAQEVAVSIGRRPFDLVNGPLLFCAIVRLADDEYILLFTPHHLVSDGWSNMIFAAELKAILAALSSGGSVSIPEPDLQYIDFVLWEREWMQSKSFHESLDYWKTRLGDDPEPLALPVDRPRPPVMTYAGAMEEMAVEAELLAELKRFCREQTATLYQVMLAAFKTLLYRYTGQSDLVVGMPVANRNRREFQKVIGLFTNTLALRTSIEGEMSFTDFLEQVKKVVQEALNHQQLPFERLIQELNPVRTLSVHPFYQVLLAQQTVPAGMKRFKVDYASSKFDLNLWIEEGDDGVSFTLTYNSDIFERATARRLLTHLKTLLGSVIATPEVSLRRLRFISADERSDILGRSGAVSTVPRREGTFPDLLSEQVRLRGDCIAVQHGDWRMTYAELNREANRIAHCLLARSIGVESRVGLLVERTPRSIAALLGIMKAGAAYVPLDPAFPFERREAILREADAALLLVDRCFVNDLSTSGTAPLFLDDPEIMEAEEGDPLVDLRREHLAYVIFTSGTTGVPKGVCVEHRNLVNYCHSVWKAMRLPAAPRCATVSSLAADLGNTMIFPTLAFGGCVEVVPRELATDARGLGRYFADYPPDCLKIVPSHLKSLLDADNPRNLIPTKLLVLGGESCSLELVEKIWKLRPECRILNHYGPTETTIGVLTFEVESDLPAGRPFVPLGRPLEGTAVYLLDEARELVPAGVPAEIYIGGETVSRGYWQNEELTAERFISDPFADNGGRLYGTGDIGKQLPDGSIAFLGRIDRQIKVRGFRVELGEIEAALVRLPWIDRAVVVPPSPGDPRQAIVAYVKAKDTRDPDLESIKRNLALSLPSHALPSSYVLLDEIPLTHNGKIDYRALPGLENFRAGKITAAPRDSLEVNLVRVWEDILGTDGIGIDDDFFALGGHSLLAVRLMSRIAMEFHVHLPLACLFDSGTIKHLSAIIRSERSVDLTSPLVSIQTRGEDSPLFFVHPAGGNVLCYYALAKSLGTRRPFYGLQSMPRREHEAMPQSIRHMARGYLDAVLKARPDVVPVYGGWSMGALVAFEMARLDHQERGRLPIVFVLDQVAPQVTPFDAGDPADEISGLVAFGAKVSQLTGQDLGLDRHLLENKSPQERALEFLRRFKECALTPEDTSVQDFEGFLGLMLHHNCITRAYSPDPYAGKIVVIRADTPLPVDSRLAAAMGAPLERASDLGWGKFSEEPVEIINVPGNHITMMTSPHVEALAFLMSRWLDGGSSAD